MTKQNTLPYLRESVLSLLATLAWYWWTPELGWVAAPTGLAVGAGMSVVPQWLGDINAKWATRNMKAREAFKCISCVDRKIRELSNSSQLKAVEKPRAPPLCSQNCILS